MRFGVFFDLIYIIYMIDDDVWDGYIKNRLLYRWISYL